MKPEGIVNVLIHDNRLYGGTAFSQFDACLQIKRRTPLSLILDWIWVTGDRFGYIDELHLWAHGIEAHGNGGLGVQFGADGINLDNVHNWSGIAGWVDWIKLLACKAADNTGSGNGMALCSQLASYSQAWLTASMDRQLYQKNSIREIEMGGWEGRVYSWDPNGNQTRTYY